MPRFAFVLICSMICSHLFAAEEHAFSWKKTPDAAKLRNCLLDMAKLVRQSGIPLAGSNGQGSPMISSEGISFNGKEPYFQSEFKFPGTTLDNRCRTSGKPYDSVVGACLLIARDHFSTDELVITTEGKWGDASWNAATSIYRQTFNKEPKNPYGKPGPMEALNSLPSFDYKSFVWKVLVFAVLAAAIVWWMNRPKYAFQLLISHGELSVVRGKPPRHFVKLVQEYVKEQDLRKGTVNARRGGSGLVFDFSEEIKGKHHIPIRQLWLRLLADVSPSSANELAKTGTEKPKQPEVKKKEVASANKPSTEKPTSKPESTPTDNGDFEFTGSVTSAIHTKN